MLFGVDGGAEVHRLGPARFRPPGDPEVQVIEGRDVLLERVVRSHKEPLSVRGIVHVAAGEFQLPGLRPAVVLQPGKHQSRPARRGPEDQLIAVGRENRAADLDRKLEQLRRHPRRLLPQVRSPEFRKIDRHRGGEHVIFAGGRFCQGEGRILPIPGPGRRHRFSGFVQDSLEDGAAEEGEGDCFSLDLQSGNRLPGGVGGGDVHGPGERSAGASIKMERHLQFHSQLDRPFPLANKWRRVLRKSRRQECGREQDENRPSHCLNSPFHRMLLLILFPDVRDSRDMEFVLRRSAGETGRRPNHKKRPGDGKGN